ncbi:MAG: hypothetical protein ACYTFY_19360, partial [Planctomycetota bacterium]|jgi:hypothetical protein
MRSKLRGDMCADLIQTFTDTLENLDKEPIVRSWVMSKWADVLPRNIDYATKFSAFDACWGGPDPAVHEWMETGHSMLETVCIEAENCGPVLWHDEKWSNKVAEINNDLDINGCIIHINMQWGHSGHISSFTSAQNITRMLESLSPEIEKRSSEEEFVNFFGPEHGKDIYKAAQLIATFPLHMTSIVHLFSEGFSYGMPPWFDGEQRWPGVLGTEKYEPAEWANPEKLTTIYQHIKAVAKVPAGYAEIIENPQSDCLSRCDEIAAWCRDAVKILESCDKLSSPQAQSELRALIASAHIAEEAALEHAAVMRARIAWEAVKSEAADDNLKDKARDCAVRYYEKAIGHLSKQIPQGTESHETFNRLTMAARLRLRKEELEKIKTVTGPDWEKEMTVDFKVGLPNSIGSKF